MFIFHLYKIIIIRRNMSEISGKVYFSPVFHFDFTCVSRARTQQKPLCYVTVE